MSWLARRTRQARKLARLLGSSRFRAGLARGVAASVEHENALRGQRFRTVVDVGANRGQFSLFASDAFPGATIHAFEPYPPAAARLSALFEGDPCMTVHTQAVGDAEGTATLHVSRRDDSSSLLPITSAQEAVFPGTGPAGRMEVPVGPLDGVLGEDRIEPPALLKIDVQGFELQALRGCSTLLPCFDRVLVECSFIELYEGQALANEVVAFLQGAGFLLVGIDNLEHDRQRRAVQADFLFANERRTGRLSASARGSEPGPGERRS